MEVIAFFSVDDRDGDPAKKPECHEPLLGIGQAIVFIRIGDPIKTSCASTKSNPCFLRFAQRLAPFQVINCGVYIRIEYASRDASGCTQPPPALSQARGASARDHKK